MLIKLDHKNSNICIYILNFFLNMEHDTVLKYNSKYTFIFL